MSEPPPLDFSFIEPTLTTPIRLATDPAAGAGGAFLIDPDRAERFIAEIRSSAQMLNGAIQAARDSGDIKVVPGSDPVTANAAVQANRMADNAERAITAYQQQLRDTADQLQTQLAAYQATEQANSAGPW